MTIQLNRAARLRGVGIVLLAAGMAFTTVPAGAVTPRADDDSSAAPDQASLEHRALERYGQLPMRFEQNVGQTDGQVRFLARGGGYALFLTDREAVLSLSSSHTGARAEDSLARGLAPGAATKRAERPEATGDVLRMSFAGGRAGAVVTGERELETKSNYLLGGDDSAWKRNVPNFGRVRYEGIYGGVDAVFYGTGQQLEYDVEVAPGADASQVRVRFEGQESMEVSEEGDLVLHLRSGEIRQQRAVVYQEGTDGKQHVGARYELLSDGEVGFALEGYDAARPLVIDPVLVYADYLGGGGAWETGDGIAVDAAGSAYITGETGSIGFPTTPGSFDASFGGIEDVFVAKLSVNGSALVYSTFLGGVGDDLGGSIAVDASGAAYVTGETLSWDFPVTVSAFDTAYNGSGDVFVTKLGPSGGSLSYSTFLGGTQDDQGNGIAVDGSGAAYVTGYTHSADFPVTAFTFDPTINGVVDVFVAKLATNGNTLTYATYLGGSDLDIATGIAVGSSGTAYVTGYTQSTNFPTTFLAYDRTFNGVVDVFVTELNASGKGLVYSTYVGSSNVDYGSAIAVDGAGAACVTGYTSSPGYPTTPGAYDNTYNGGNDVFVTKVSATGGALLYSTFVGGLYDDVGYGIALDGSGAAYVTGETDWSNFPVTANAFDTTYNGNGDAFVAKLSSNGSTLVYSTFFGGASSDYALGIAVDASGATFLTGSATSMDFPTSPGAYDATYNGVYDVFATKLSASGGSIAYSTFIGGTRGDVALAIAADGSGATYIAGYTESASFPTTAGAYDQSFNSGLYDGFVSELNASGTALVFATYLGGSGLEACRAIAIGQGGVYVAGFTNSAVNFPTTAGAFDTTFNGGGNDAFVTKLTANGSSLGYSTFLGGADNDFCYGIAVDASGAAYVTGYTGSSNFPTTLGAYDTTFNGNTDAFVTKFAQNGSLLSSTLIGGSDLDAGSAIAVDSAGMAYVTGDTYSSNFPATPGAFDTTFGGAIDAFVAKLSPNGSSLLYATYLGGVGEDIGFGIAVDGSGVGVPGAAYVTGFTGSLDFPTTQGAFDTTLDGAGDAFVTKLLTTNGSPLIYSTLLGGSWGDIGSAIAVDGSGAAYVTGYTSSPDFPTTATAFDTTYDGNTDAFVAKLNASGTAPMYSTYLGGTGFDACNGIALDGAGRACVTGQTTSISFFTGGVGYLDGSSAFVAKVN